MQKYTEIIIDMVKKKKLFVDQGGPIIMAQIENEYNNVQLSYREAGKCTLSGQQIRSAPHTMASRGSCASKRMPPTVWLGNFSFPIFSV